MRRFHVGWLALSSLVACKDEIDLDPVDDSPVIESRVRPKPIIGGTLTIASGLAVASDPDRDTIHIVDIQDSRSELHTIALEPGEEPGRVVAGVEGIAHVVLRGSGNVGTIDLRAGTITRHRVCTDPRGIAFQADADALYVACAGGSVLTLAAQTGEIVERVELEPDLRDVVIADGRVMVSKFREATVLGLDGSRLVVPDGADFDPFTGEGTTRRAGAAWKAGVTEDGEIYLLHHMASTAPIPIEVEPEDIEGFDGGGGGGAYGGGGSSLCHGGITTPVLTLFRDGEALTFALQPKLTVDAVMTADGYTAVAQPGAAVGKSTLDVFSFAPRDQCGEDPTSDTGEGQVTAVALTEAGDLVVQSREPARLSVRYDDGTRASIELAGESRFDTGHEIFHRVTDSLLSCASCHPEGTDDGHVWTFIDIGPRRTQALDIRLEGTEPFHWDGDMDDLDMIMGEVLTHRMGGKRQSSDRRASFRSWLFEQERPPTRAVDLDAAQVEEGAALFDAYGCGTCHSGPGLGGATTERFGALELQVPSLRRVSLRAPFMHDGRSADLDAAVRDMVVGSGRGEAPDEDVAAMVAYLRTL
jgi:mono/diheme cytochrome c family protein